MAQATHVQELKAPAERPGAGAAQRVLWLVYDASPQAGARAKVLDVIEGIEADLPPELATLCRLPRMRVGTAAYDAWLQFRELQLDNQAEEA